MILFTNGCSWTWGGGLEPHFRVNDINQDDIRLQLVWPHHLGKLLNADKVVNLSIGCGSNQRIVRTTHDWFLHEYKNYEPIVAVIQITDPARYEYYMTDNFEDFTNDPLFWTRITPTSVMFNLDNSPSWSLDYQRREIIANRERDSRMSTYTLIEGMYKFINTCSALAHLFEKHNVEYYFFGGYFKYRPNYPIEYKNYLTKLHYVDTEWATVDPISAKDSHPSLLGHQQIADMLYKIIRP